MKVSISVGGINVERRGEGSSVVFLHGIPTHSYLWRNVVSNLTGFTSITIDMMGYGYSDKPEGIDLSLSAQANYVVEALEKLGVEKFHLVGHDIGGGVAQIIAVNNTDAVKSITLIDSVGLDYWPVPEIARLKDPIWDRLIEKVDMVEGIKRGLAKGMVRKDRLSDEVAKEYAKPFSGSEGKKAYLRAARALDFRDTMRVADKLRDIECPVLLIWGAEDEYIPPMRGRRLIKYFREAEMITMEKTGHFSPEDNPSLLAAITRAWLKTVEG